MNYVNELSKIKDEIQREIIYKVVSYSRPSSEITIEFNTHPEFPCETPDGFPVKITLQGLECNTGRIYDTNNNVVPYQSIPIEVLLKVHQIVVNSEDFTYKSTMFI